MTFDALKEGSTPTSYCTGKFLACGSGRTWTHLLLSTDLTSSVRLSLVHLRTTQTRFLYDVGRFTWMMFHFNQTLVWNSLFLNLNGNFTGIYLFYSHMLGLGSAALEGLVWFTDQTIAPALSTDKLHFHVQILPSSTFSSGFTPTTSRRQLHTLNENNEKTDLRSTLHLSLLIINEPHKKYLQSTNKKGFSWSKTTHKILYAGESLCPFNKTITNVSELTLFPFCLLESCSCLS